MLQAAQSQLRQGVKLRAGVVETHPAGGNRVPPRRRAAAPLRNSSIEG
ncbi:hypothetical protein P4238_21850 [Pseudomonas aeruginosa]|nr:hypothetical protein [Pseudomonas aeruginosa]